MDFRRIQHFIHTAELGSVSKASKRLNIVQPALSQSLKRLEEDLGVALFTRSRRGMELTDAGTTFLEHAYGILNQYNKAKESISAIGKVASGQVSIALTSSTLNVMAVPLCQAIQEHYPDISLSLEEGLAANIQLGLNAGWYDLVISHLAEPGQAAKSEPLIEEELFLAGPQGADLPEGVVDFRALENIPLIIPQDHHGVRQEIHQAASKVGISLPQHQVSAALHPTLQMIESHMGYSLVPWSAIYDRVETGKICGRRIANPTLHQKVSMVHPAHKPLTPATIAVMDLVRKTVKNVYQNGKWRGRLLVDFVDGK